MLIDTGFLLKWQKYSGIKPRWCFHNSVSVLIKAEFYTLKSRFHDMWVVSQKKEKHVRLGFKKWNLSKSI